MKRQTIDELNQMSKEITGVKSKWRSLINKGEVVEVVEIVDHLSIKDGKEVKEKMEIPYLKETKDGNQIPVYTLKRHDLDTVKVKLLELKAQQDKFREMVQQLEKETKIKEQAKAEVAKSSGSSTHI